MATTCITGSGYRLKKFMVKLVVDNTNVIKKQPFRQRIVVTRDEMKELRNGFDKWMEKR